MHATTLEGLAQRWRAALPANLSATDMSRFLAANRFALSGLLTRTLNHVDRRTLIPSPYGALARRMPIVLSYGGGADSFAMLLDAIQRGEWPDVVAFVDVSDGTATRLNLDPGEWPGTYRHLREVVMPLCARLGIEFVWIDSERYPVRDSRSLFAWMLKRGQIPVAGPTRICTPVAKVERFDAWMNTRFPGQDVEVWVGFEAGEESRAEKDPNAGPRRPPKPGRARRHNRFPLIEQNLCRCRAVALIRKAGFPVPRKSACVFCPYASLADWQTAARDIPRDFAQSVALEASKPPTSSGKKLSIMGFRTLKDRDGTAIGYKANPLPVYIQGTPRPRVQPCTVCGAPQRATKATGVDYLDVEATEALPACRRHRLCRLSWGAP